jgi:hypothetical protein
MTQRERILAIAVAALLILFGLNLGLRSLVGTLNDREDQVDRAFADLQSLNNTIRMGTKVMDSIGTLTSKSLPRDREAAESQYTSWLYELASDAGMRQIKVVAQGRPIKVVPQGQPLGTPEAYTVHEFQLSGLCEIDRVIDLLGNYYDRDYLHQISSLKLSPTRDSNAISVDLTSRAISLSKADPKQEASLASSGRLSMPIDQYKQVILNRNPISPPNRPPVFGTRPTHEVAIGQSWQLNLQADDPDGNQVTFELVSDTAELAEGLTMEGSQLRWRPEEKGEQQVTVRAVDNGWPRNSAELTLVLKAVEPAAPAAKTPAVDPAEQAFLTGLVSGRGGSRGWIRSQLEGTSVDIFEGAEIQIGSVTARVVSINVLGDYVELETDGNRWTVDMNTSLADAFKASRVD